jgi:hypothetical protein
MEDPIISPAQIDIPTGEVLFVAYDGGKTWLQEQGTEMQAPNPKDAQRREGIASTVARTATRRNASKSRIRRPIRR